VPHEAQATGQRALRLEARVTADRGLDLAVGLTVLLAAAGCGQVSQHAIPSAVRGRGAGVRRERERVGVAEEQLADGRGTETLGPSGTDQQAVRGLPLERSTSRGGVGE